MLRSVVRNQMLMVALLTLSGILTAQEKMKVYLLPGQGSDHRVFQRMQLDPERYDTVHVQYPIPDRKDDMRSYAQTLAGQIDSSGRYAFIGVSLGGMLSCELGEMFDPEAVILVSSAKNRSELPKGYRTQKQIPLYRIIPSRLIKASTFILQPLFESDRHEHKEVFKAMLRSKDRRFVKRAIRLIVTWDRQEAPTNVFHIHGGEDNTLPIKRINTDHVIKDGSHMMMLNDTPRVQAVIERELSGRKPTD